MAQTTMTLSVGKSSELLADVRNAGNAFFEKKVFIFAHRYTVTKDYTAGYGLTINIDGAQKILFASVKEVLAATNTDLNAVESDYATGVGKTLTTATSNGSSLAVEVFIICEV
jgi:hypothetical protein